MTTIVVADLLQPIAPDLPCGPDLYDDVVFREMEEAAYAEPHPQFGEPIESNWTKVSECALELALRTKDLRVAVYLVRAGLVTDGLPAFCATLELIRDYIEQDWDDLHPQLDDGDPTYRINQLRALCHRESTLSYLDSARLLSADDDGPSLCLCDLRTQRDKAQVAASNGKQREMMVSIDAVMMDCEPARVEEAQAVAQECVGHLQAIERTVNAWVMQADLTEAIRDTNLLDLEHLTTKLQRAAQFLQSHLVNRDDADAVTSDDAVPTANNDAASPASSSQNPSLKATSTRMQTTQHPLSPGAMSSPADVKLALDRICEYYERYEPSSPLPPLIRLGRRLVSKGFFEITDMLPPELVQALRTLEETERPEEYDED